MQTGSFFDVMLNWPDVEAVLREIDAFLHDLEEGNRVASPSKDTCLPCPFDDCLARWQPFVVPAK